ncbi:MULTISPECIES: helix-turn-helix domain-containing protein [Fusobacterium]|jgi:transcriptional regulator with XRE-family HTH domain|uniref:helix-turn-helix domain-containing protein n=1 Tax=Fusobacterium TaxID=848 RepID=UPI000E9EFF19|nr:MULTISPECIES: helix-turn-helix transcriptional regulator [Fusobacterium]HBJ80222.1 hypothetical protein [Fusobacterium sp.]
MKFGEVLRKIRTEHGDSLRGLAEKTGVYFTYIAKIETGEKSVTKEILEKLIEEYPLQKNEFIESYIKELLPDFVLKEIKKQSVADTSLTAIKDVGEKELYNLLFKGLEVSEQKEILNTLLERLEVLHFKKGTLEKNKKKLEVIKKEIEKIN